MNRGEFERLKARFGDKIVTWPAPHCQEAKFFLAQEGSDTTSDDEKLDRLVLEAAIVPTDEQALARKVTTRIGQPKRGTFLPLFDLRTLPVTAASMALVLMASAVGGYVAAGADTEISDNALLAFAVGVPPSELAETIGVSRSNGGRL